MKLRRLACALRGHQWAVVEVLFCGAMFQACRRCKEFGPGDAYPASGLRNRISL